ncbi:MAG: hypothetical protein A2Z25_18620 [Planctomycetes bacterium RBG_16_55_9]|nr:MAG: hypothetical protein A2Z25_18620 [Planctomycetes bacterium RBG_16_55_9]
MAKIAVDVVLLPQEQVADRAVEINRELLKQCPDKIVLDKAKCLPHISLAMGCIDDKDIADIERVLRMIAENHRPGKLYNEGIYTGTNASNEQVSVLQLKKTKPLQKLHEIVMEELAPHFSYEVSADMLLPPAATEGTLLWIKNYPEKSSFERFSPHITLGYGRLDNVSFPSRFSAQKLALCHLGNHCTCRKILASVEFSD